MQLSHDRLKSPLGTLHLVSKPDGTLIALDFDGAEARLHRLLAKRFQTYTLNQQPLKKIKDSLRSYFEGNLMALDLIETQTGGTDFQRAVWQSLKQIKPGTTQTYRELAQRIGNPRAIRAVAHANAQNPLSLFYPCHRVIGSDGQLRGYAGGLSAKDWLLRHEGVRVTWS